VLSLRLEATQGEFEMKRPEYWEDDETWAAYEAYQAGKQPSPIPPSNPVPKWAQFCREQIEPNVEESIGWLNELIRLWRKT
jgi:hypothetical protein